jgi:translation initiation factor eIF-2B subunit epsilon
MEIRTDLIDCGIDICTPDVLALWAESFDYEVPRRHFLHGVLKDYELNGKTIHTEVVDEHYAARVFNLQSYEAVSKDVLGRWTYPLVPDSNLVAGQTYKFERGGICKENGVILARTCKAGKRTVLGKDTSIGDRSTISNSIIGRRCHIGKDVSIQNAFIWDDVVIGDGATINRAIIASEAVIGKKVNIEPGALLSWRVRIADNKEVKSGSRITRAKRKPEHLSDEIPKPVPSDPAVVGGEGEGYLFDDDEDSDDEAFAFHSNLIYSTSHLNISSESISTIHSDISVGTPTETRSRHSSFAASISDDGEPSSSSNEAFHHDAVAGLIDALKENGDFESGNGTRLEFTGLRLSNNATDRQVRRAIATAFTKRISQLVEAGKPATEAAASTFAISGAVGFLNEVAIGLEKAEDDQVDFIYALQRDLVHRGNGATTLAAVSQKLYDLEVIEEEAFLRWWEESEGAEKEDEEMKRVREKTKVFIDWLEEAEEDDSDQGSDSD